MHLFLVPGHTRTFVNATGKCKFEGAVPRLFQFMMNVFFVAGPKVKISYSSR